jgi:hypothetical protein
MTGFDRREAISGAVFVAIGAFFTLHAWLRLPAGEAFQMGPGFFPMLLGGVLILLGLGVVVSARRAEPTERPPVPWRGVALVTGAVLFFGGFARPLGFAPALAVATMMAAMAPDRSRLATAAVLTLVLTAFNVTVFVLLLRLPYPLIGPWLGG